ncbi:unnamed protein product, partial [Effrenium voratum]
SLDFADSIYYQVQFMTGRAIQPFVEQEDAELLQDEPPRVTLKLLCSNMVMRARQLRGDASHTEATE